MALGSTAASAQQREKVVTGSFSYLAPSSIEMLDEYMSNQMYSGALYYSGWDIKLSALYKKYDNLSWDLYFNTLSQGNSEDISELMSNPSNSQYLTYNGYNLGYGTYYHWNFGRKLMIKAGGKFDLYGAKKETKPDGLDNCLNMEGQIMLKAHAAIKYGWDFKKWALDLSLRASLPMLGVITADHPSEPALALLGNDHNILNAEYNHIFLASYHNYMSLDYEFDIDFVLRHCTLTLGIGSTNKWWNVYDVQNIRKINYISLGIAFDLVTRNKFKSTNKNF